MSRFKAYGTYSDTADALYVHLSRADEVETTRSLDDRRMVDYDASGCVAGIEFLDASAGVDLHGVPELEQVERVVRGFNFPVFV
jgi:uncharacterized protein YuzE